MAEKIYFENYFLELETLTPIHIGSGQKLAVGLDVFFDGEYAGKVDMKKMYKHITNQSDWVHKIMEGENIFNDLKTRGIQLEEVCNEIIPIKKHKGRELYEFIRNRKSTNPIVPGTSIKGAIRTSLLAPSLKKYYSKNIHEVEHFNIKALIKNDNQVLKPLLEIKKSNRYSKKINPQNDIFKYLQIGDAEGDIKDLFIDTFLTLNMDRDESWYIKQQLTQTKELFYGKVNFKVRLNEKFWKDNRFEIKDFREMLKVIDVQNRHLLQKELENFKYDLEDGYITTEIGDKIIGAIEAILDLPVSENTALMRMSSGSGWDYITGSWFKELTSTINKEDLWVKFLEIIRKGKYKDLPFPKTRRLTSSFEFPGFVVLKWVK